MKILAWIFKVISFTWCNFHFPSFIHSIYLHLHPLPLFSLHQKAWKPTRIQGPTNRTKLGFSSFQGSKLSRCDRAHQHDCATLGYDISLSFSLLGVRLAWIFSSPDLYIRFYLPRTHFASSILQTLLPKTWGLKTCLNKERKSTLWKWKGMLG